MCGAAVCDSFFYSYWLLAVCDSLHNYHYRQSQQRLNTIALFNHEEGSQEEVYFLDTPVVVYGGLIVSASNCSIKNMTLKMNISIRDRQLDGIMIITQHAF